MVKQSQMLLNYYIGEDRTMTSRKHYKTVRTEKVARVKEYHKKTPL